MPNHTPDIPPIRMHYSWSTWQVSGTTVTAVTCGDWGLDTVEIQFGDDQGENLDKITATNGTQCAAGGSVYDWQYGPANINMYLGLKNAQLNATLFAGISSFVLAPGVTDFVVPEIKIIFASYPLMWTIQQGATTVTCSDANAQTVAFSLEKSGVGFSNTTTWSENCGASGLKIPPINSGTYALSAILKSATGVELAKWSAPAFQVTDQSAPDLPPIQFTLP